MIVPNPIRLAIASAAFGAGVTMIVFGALKGAIDIINENEQQKKAGQPVCDPAFVEPEFVAAEHVTTAEPPIDSSDDYSV